MNRLLAALLALILALTSVGQVMAHTAHGLGRDIILCAEGTEQAVRLDAAGNPIGAPHDCQDCLSALTATPAAPPGLPTLRPGTWAALQPAALSLPAPTPAWLRPAARGPPSRI